MASLCFLPTPAAQACAAGVGKKHSEATKASIYPCEKKNKYPLGVGIYDLEEFSSLIIM